MSSQKQIQVVFVCLGNICRSPMAEAIFLTKVQDQGLLDHFLIDSAGTGGYHNGENYHQSTLKVCKDRKLIVQGKSRQFQKNDFKQFDYILAMDNNNALDLESYLVDEADLQKVSLIMNYATSSKEEEVPDPYFGGPQGFDFVYHMLEDACTGLLEKIIADHNLK